MNKTTLIPENKLKKKENIFKDNDLDQSIHTISQSNFNKSTVDMNMTTNS